MHKLLGLLLLCCWLPFASAADVPAALIKTDVCGYYAVLHINGVDNLRTDAERNLSELSIAYGNAHDGHRLRYGLGYNRSINQATDIAKAMQLTLAEFPGATYEEWVLAFYRGIFSPGLTSTILAAITTRLTQLFNPTRPDNFYDSDLVYILNDLWYLGYKSYNARLLIVGHSEGSIFANILFRKLTAPASDTMHPGQIGLMSIAPFVSSLAGTGSMYVSNQNDRPVTMARSAYPAILRHTVTIPHTEPEIYIWRGHNLITKYLTDAVSRKQIKDNMEAVMYRLASNPTWVPAVVWPYPAPIYTRVYYWANCSATSPCTDMINGQYVHFSAPYLEHPTINVVGSWTMRYGALSEAHSIARANAGACYTLTNREEVRLRTAGSTAANLAATIYGCLVGPNYGSGSAWFAYSGDLPPSFQDTYSAAGSSVTVIAGATCRRPAAT